MAKAAETKAKSSRAPSAAASELRKKVLGFMRKGKEYTSREIVEGVGRTPGAKEGGPVIRLLKTLVEEKVVRHAPNEGGRGQSWVRS